MTSISTDTGDRTRPHPRRLAMAWAAMTLGLLYAAVSVYWGLGGTRMLDTVGGSLERGGRAGNPSTLLMVWAAVVLKVIAAMLPLLLIYRLGGRKWHRLVVVLTWIEAAILVSYGLVFTAVGLMVQFGVIAASATADHRALAWHAYFWDPWFLVWGLVVAAVLLGTRRRSTQSVMHPDGAPEGPPFPGQPTAALK